MVLRESKDFEINPGTGEIDTNDASEHFVQASELVPGPLALDAAYPRAVLDAHPWGYWRTRSRATKFCDITCSPRHIKVSRNGRAPPDERQLPSDRQGKSRPQLRRPRKTTLSEFLGSPVRSPRQPASIVLRTLRQAQSRLIRSLVPRRLTVIRHSAGTGGNG